MYSSSEGEKILDQPVGSAKRQQHRALPHQWAVELTKLVKNTQTQLGAPLVDWNRSDLTLEQKQNLVIPSACI